MENHKIKDKTSLNNVHALQLLSYNETEKKSELNLILEDGHRVHVCSYENNDNTHEQIQEDADKIAKYINKPVWNALA
jgi:transposase